MTANSYEANATQDGIEAVAKFTSKLGLIVTVVVAAILKTGEGPPFSVGTLASSSAT